MRDGLVTVNLTLRFVLELVLLGAVADYGYRLGDGWTSAVYPVIFAGAVAVIWGLVVSPKATWPAPVAVRFAVEVALWAAGAAAIASDGHPAPAAAFFAVAVAGGVANLRGGGRWFGGAERG